MPARREVALFDGRRGFNAFALAEPRRDVSLQTVRMARHLRGTAGLARVYFLDA
jgi:hypothetical protein